MQLIELLDDAVRVAPETFAVITETETVTFAQLRARVEARATQIAAHTEPGDRVAVLAENRTEYVELYYAVPHSGRVLVPLNHRLHPEEWRRTLARSGATLVLALMGLGESIFGYRRHTGPGNHSGAGPPPSSQT